MSDENQNEAVDVSKPEPTVLEQLESRVAALEEKVESFGARVEKAMNKLFHPSQR